jgi:hypothetical protein
VPNNPNNAARCTGKAFRKIRITQPANAGAHGAMFTGHVFAECGRKNPNYSNWYAIRPAMYAAMVCNNIDASQPARCCPVFRFFQGVRFVWFALHEAGVTASDAYICRHASRRFDSNIFQQATAR